MHQVAAQAVQNKLLQAAFFKLRCTVAKSDFYCGITYADPTFWPRSWLFPVRVQDDLAASLFTPLLFFKEANKKTSNMVYGQCGWEVFHLVINKNCHPHIHGLMLIYALCLKLLPESIWCRLFLFFISLPCSGWLAFLPHFRSPFFCCSLNDDIVVIIRDIKGKALTGVLVGVFGEDFFFAQ